MKTKNNSSDLVTKGFLKQELERELKDFEMRMDIKFDQLALKTDDKAREYRDDVLTKLDEVMG